MLLVYGAVVIVFGGMGAAFFKMTSKDHQDTLSTACAVSLEGIF